MTFAVEAVQNYDPVALVIGAVFAGVLALAAAVAALWKVARAVARVVGGLPWHAFTDGFLSAFGVAFTPAPLASRRRGTWRSLTDDLARCYAEMGPPPGGPR